MAGFASGFSQGWGLADNQIQQNKADERYKQAQATNESRYQDQQARQATQDQRANEAWDMKVEDNEYNKSQRGVREEQAKLSIQSQKENLESKDLNQRLTKQQLDDYERKVKKQNIEDAASVFFAEMDLGTPSYQSASNFYNAAKGTAFDIGHIGDDKYIQSLDTLEQVTKNPELGNSPESIESLNYIYKNEINKGGMVEGGVSKQIAGAGLVDGKLQFTVNTLDANGSVINTSPLTTTRGTDGEAVGIDPSVMVDSFAARKMVMAHWIADPQKKAKLMAIKNAIHGADSGNRGVGKNQSIPGVDKPAVDMAVGLSNQLNDALLGEPQGVGGGRGPVNQKQVDTIRTQLNNLVRQNPNVSKYIKLDTILSQEDTSTAINMANEREWKQNPDSTITPDQAKAAFIQRVQQGLYTPNEISEILQSATVERSSSDPEKQASDDALVNKAVSGSTTNKPKQEAKGSNTRNVLGMGGSSTPISDAASGISRGIGNVVDSVGRSYDDLVEERRQIEENARRGIQ